MVSSVLRRLKLDPKFAKKKNSFLGVALPVLLSQNVSPKMGNGKGGVSGVERSGVMVETKRRLGEERSPRALANPPSTFKSFSRN